MTGQVWYSVAPSALCRHLLSGAAALEGDCSHKNVVFAAWAPSFLAELVGASFRGNVAKAGFSMLLCSELDIILCAGKEIRFKSILKEIVPFSPSFSS